MDEATFWSRYNDRRILVDATVQFSRDVDAENALEPITHKKQYNSFKLTDFFQSADTLKGLVANGDDIDMVVSILDDGELDGKRFDIPWYDRKFMKGYIPRWPDFAKGLGNAEVAVAKRLALARLALKAPDVAYFVVQNDINLVHGTGVVALASILENGYLSASEQSERDVPMLTGARILSQVNDSFVGFYEWDEVTRASSHANEHSVYPLWLMQETLEDTRRRPLTSARVADLRKAVAELEERGIDEPYELVLACGASALMQYLPSASTMPDAAKADRLEVRLTTPAVPLNGPTLILSPADKMAQTREIVEMVCPDNDNFRVANLNLVNAAANPKLSHERFLQTAFDN